MRRLLSCYRHITLYRVIAQGPILITLFCDNITVQIYTTRVTLIFAALNKYTYYALLLISFYILYSVPTTSQWLNTDNRIQGYDKTLNNNGEWWMCGTTLEVNQCTQSVSTMSHPFKCKVHKVMLKKCTIVLTLWGLSQQLS